MLRKMSNRSISSLLILTAVALLLLSGCAPKANGPAFEPVQNVASDKALVYFYRPHKTLGAALANLGVLDNGTTVCNNIRMDGYCYYIAEPGSHTFATVTAAVDKQTTVDINAGDTLYFEAFHACGVWTCSYSLNRVDEQAAMAKIQMYKLQQ